MGKIIMLRDTYPYELPAEPNSEKGVLFADRKKKDQYWERPPLPDLRHMSVREKSLYIDEERRRLTEGLWMMINGELTWISPTHYDFLMYSNLPDFQEPPRYYDAQRIDFYFKDFVKQDINCFGDLTMKPRRYGYTAMAISEAIMEAISSFGANVGMISTDLDKVKETIFRPLVDSFLQRPKYVRPEIYTPQGRPPAKELRFRKNVIAEADEYMLDIGSGLRSWISPRPTTPKTFDGHKWHKIIMDEVFKWTVASLYNTWYITKETLQVGGRIIGKASLFATMGDDESCDDAVNDGIKLWGESNYQERDRFGRTPSGLFRWFVPAFVAYEMFIDKYGTCNEALAKEYLLEQRSRLEEGTLEYLYHVRRYPFTPEEAMATAQSSSTFSAIRLGARLSTIYLTSHAEKGYITGNFRWDNIRDRVVFEPNVNGYWKMAFNNHEHARNRCRFVNGRYVLPRNPEGVIGNDPVRTADNVSGHLSMNCAYVYQKYDYFGSGTANRILAQMYGRDEDVDVCNEQLRLAALYFGYPVMTERQISSTFDWFRSHGMKDFLLKDAEGATGVWMTGKLINEGLELIQSLIKKPKDDGEEDLLEYIIFEELLRQLKDFDKTKSTKYDCVMALIITLLGLKQIQYTVLTDDDIKRRRQLMGAVFPVRRAG